MHKCLQDDAHEARLSHVVEPSKADGATRKKRRVVDDELVFVGRRGVLEFSLLAYRASPLALRTKRKHVEKPTFLQPLGFEIRIVNEVLTVATVNMAAPRFNS